MRSRPKRSRCPCRSITTSTTRSPGRGQGQRQASPPPPPRVASSGCAQGCDVHSVRRSEDPFEHAGVLQVRPVRAVRRSPAVVVQHDHAQIRPRLVRADQQPIRVVQERQVTHDRVTGPTRRGGRSHSGGHGAVDTADTTVGENATGQRHRQQVGIADHRRGAQEQNGVWRQRPQSFPTAAIPLGGRPSANDSSSTRSAARWACRPASAHAVSAGDAADGAVPGRRSKAVYTRRAACVASGHRPPAVTTSTGATAPLTSRAICLDSVGRPTTSTRSGA